MRCKLIVLTLLALPGLSAYASTYNDARERLVAAYQAGNFSMMRVAAEQGLVARPEYPGALFDLAFAEALDGDAEAALATLARLTAKGIDYGVENIAAFEALQSHPGWARYLAEIGHVRNPVGSAQVAASSDRSGFVPEGIAVRNADDIVLGSIRSGQILFMASDLAEMAIGPFGHWSVFGMRFDEDGGLWFASSDVPQFAGARDKSSHTAGLFRYDIAATEISERAWLPPTGDQQTLGDLVIADADTIYTTDSTDGPVYRYSIKKGKYSVLVPKGVFGSPQGLVIDETGGYLYVADYVGGLHRVQLDDGSVEKVAVPDTISDYGIDGLYRHGNRLVAIQNGIRPHRVVAMTLSDGGSEILHAEILAMNLPEFDEPTLGTVVGDEFYFVANSHWNRFDADNKLADGLTGPIVLKLAL